MNREDGRVKTGPRSHHGPMLFSGACRRRSFIALPFVPVILSEALYPQYEHDEYDRVSGAGVISSWHS